MQSGERDRDRCKQKDLSVSDYLPPKVSDVVRSKLSKLELDQAYLQRASLQSAVEAKLAEVLSEYGYAPSSTDRRGCWNPFTERETRNYGGL
jgi:regulator of protease activity HflC (stomatin/prohibitin superfamily)